MSKSTYGTRNFGRVKMFLKFCFNLRFPNKFIPLFSTFWASQSYFSIPYIQSHSNYLHYVKDKNLLMWPSVFIESDEIIFCHLLFVKKTTGLRR